MRLAPPLPPAAPPVFQAGQWLSLHLPVGERPPLVRAYSLAAPQVPSGELVLCLDRVPGGLGSEYLFSLQPGDIVEYSGPLGNFVMREDAHRYLWVARYTGIVPFRAMALALRAQEAPPHVHLVYSGASREDLPYGDELQQLAARTADFEVEVLVGADPEAAVEQVVAHLERIGYLAPGDGAPVPMLCGVRQFVRPVRDYLVELGWERRAVRMESYD